MNNQTPIRWTVEPNPTAPPPPVGKTYSAATAYNLGLILSFPCLKRKVHVESFIREVDPGYPLVFVPTRFMAQFKGASPGEYMCAAFVVGVYNPANAKKWKFDFFDFASTADPLNRQPVLEWLANPRWP